MPIRLIIVGSFGQIRVSRLENDRQGQVVEEGIVRRPMANSHETIIFAQDSVATAVIVVFYRPMSPIECQQSLSVGSLSRQRSDAASMFHGVGLTVQMTAVSDDPKGLEDMRQFDGSWKGFIGLNAPLIDAAVSFLRVFGEPVLGHPIPIQAGQLLREFGMILFNREEKMGFVNQHDGIGHDSVSMERIDRNDGSPDSDILQESRHRRLDLGTCCCLPLYFARNFPH